MKITNICFALVALGLSLATGRSPARAMTAPWQHGLIISNAWSRPTPAGLPTGVVYMTISNATHAGDRLIAATTPVAAAMQLHRSTMSHGIMSMTAVAGGLDIPAGATVQIAPNGYHFMLTGLKQGLRLGGHFPVTLTFAHAGVVKTEVQVRPGPPTMQGMEMR